MHARWIDVPAPEGGTFKAWLTLPPTGSGPGIVLLQEIWGVNEHIRAVAEQYALDGFVVLAPDVFWRDATQVDLKYDAVDTQQAYALMRAVDPVKSTADLVNVVQTLRALPEVTGKVASIGYCMGGRLSFLAAANAGVDVAVAYYGGGIQNFLDQAGKISAPMLFHYGALDSHIPADAVAAVRATMGDRANVEIVVHDGAGHGFNCWGRPDYHQQRAVQAHAGTLAFLGKYLY